MRVEGQGMATDYFPAKSDPVGKPMVQKGKTKVGMEQLNIGNNTKANTEKSITKNSPKTDLEQANTGDGAKVDSEKSKNTSLEAIKEAVEVVNNALNISSFHLEFRLYEDTDVYQVRMIDNQSEEIIKEIPPDYMLDLSKRVQEIINKAVGILVDELV